MYESQYMHYIIMTSLQAEVEITQHCYDRDAVDLEKRKSELEQKLAEEKKASESILNYLDKHYTVRNLSLSLSIDHTHKFSSSIYLSLSPCLSSFTDRI